MSEIDPISPEGAPRFKQHGSALLAFMLIVVVGASFILVSNLNANVRQYARQAASTVILAEAKNALIAYAINYPENHPGEGPGYLPCPDISNNGSAGGSCSLAGGTTIGRFPWKTLELDNLRDDAGESLWYAVSDNFKNNPKAFAALNSDTPADFSVDGNGEVVAVIFAPGPPLAGQNRPAGPLAVANYLEDDNADGDASFVSRASGTFNDQIAVVTRKELMAAVEQRVINQLRTALKSYYDAYTAYPWLTPFADPKASRNELRGSHNGSDNSSTLDDSNADFTAWGVQAGDVVFNVTDGSIGVVTSATASSLSFGSLLFGTDNDFDDDDEYVVYVQALGARLKSTATSGSSGMTLTDTNRDFVALGVTPGDIIDKFNGTSMSSGAVQTVSANQLTVASLSGSATNSFASGETYVIRSNYGSATGANNSANLTDAYKNFQTMGIKAGDLVVNITDGSLSRVQSVSSATTLLMDTPILGTDNDFDTGDNYYIPRFGTDSATREGLLSVHRPGEYFRTGFNMDWSLLGTNGITISTNPSSAQTTYKNKVKTDIESSGSTFAIASSDGACVWREQAFIDCYGEKDISSMATTGVITSGSNTSTVTDSTQSFTTNGVKRGDLIQNFNDESDLFTRTADAGSSGTTLYDLGATFLSYDTSGPYELLVRNNATGIQGVVTQIVDNNTLIASSYPGGPAISFSGGNSYTLRQPQYMVVRTVASATSLTTSSLTATVPDFDSGEYYRIVPAALSISGSMDAVSGSTWMRDSSHDFNADGVEVGDIVEAGSTSNRSFGIINVVSGPWINATLYGGSSNTFFTSPYTYTVYHGYVSSRKFTFKVRFRGDGSSVYGTSGVRKRSACIGYDATCATTASSTNVPYDFSIPTITIRDYEDDGDLVATTTSTIPSTGTPIGRLRVADVDYYLAEDGSEVPDWFVRNKWYQDMYISFAVKQSPGVSGNCAAGTDCLSIQGKYSTNDTQAIVLSAGKELGNATCPDLSAQNRVNARVCDYFEGDNATTGDDTFQRDATTSFNDRLITVYP